MGSDFITLALVPGIQGLDIRRPLDLIDQLHLPRMANCVRNGIGELTGRPGQTTLFSDVVGEIGYVEEMNIPNTLGISYTHDFVIATTAGTIWTAPGTSTSQNDATQISSGFGPVTTGLVFHPPNTGAPTAYLASTLKMGKIQAGIAVLKPIGFPAPPQSDARFRIDEFAVSTPDGSISAIDRMSLQSVGFTITDVTGGGQQGMLTAYGTLSKTTIDNCDTAGWTNNAGTGGVPANAADATDKKEGTASLKLTTEKGGAGGAYYNFWSKTGSKDLSQFLGIPASDDDIIHLWIKTDRPDKIAEFRIYFVCDSSFNTATLPGTSTTLDIEAYVKAFRPSDFATAYEIFATSLATGTTAVGSRAVDQQLHGVNDTRGSTQLVREKNDPERSIASQLGPGIGWTEYGIIGLPLRRGEFLRLGSDSSRGWNNVTGMVLAAQTTDNTDNINIWLDDLYFTGGAGLDTAEIGATPYDYRYTYFDPSTGVEGNPSPIQGAGYRLDSLRRPIVVTPVPYGETGVIERFYRRGGTLQNNWYYLGQNSTDGGTYTDILSDAAIIAAGTLDIDNDQPVTTEDKDGNVVLAAPLAAIFGPYSDIIFGCGDQYQKGFLYWCKPTKPDAWPAAYAAEVCSPSEELMQGGIFQGQAFVLSRERMYAIIPNLQNLAIVVTTPTQCQHGLVSRRGLAIGAGAIHFVSKDGVYRTQGGAEESITEQQLWHLFHGESRFSLNPVDWAYPDKLQLEIHGLELWFTYQDTSGATVQLIFDTVFQYWRPATFGYQVSHVHSIMGATDFSAPLYVALGAKATGKVYSHTGTSDDGLAISGRFTTPAIDAGQPRNDKLFGDIMLDMDRAGNTVTVTPYFNSESSSSAPASITTLAGRQRYYVDAGTTQAFNCSIDVAWSTTSTPPTIYKLGPSIVPQADTTEARVTDWESVGTMADKYVKGILLECDTGGLTKTMDVMGDGVVQTSVSFSANGRQVVELSWTQFQARLLRLKPTDTVQWKLYDHMWLFDVEPMAISRWESQEISHGIPGWQSPLYAYITIRSSAQVTLQLTSYQQNGSSAAKTYTLASTGGVKQQLYVPFEATKGVLFKYLFTSGTAFWLYRPESVVWVQPWAGGQSVPVRPFGDDDQDLVRSSVNAQFAAQRSGGAGWLVPKATAPSGNEGDFSGQQ